MVSELRGARVHARHGPDPVRAGQAPALGGRLLRAPHQPPRPSPPPHPQHRPPQVDHGGEHTLTWCPVTRILARRGNLGPPAAAALAGPVFEADSRPGRRHALRLPWAAMHTRTRLHRSTASRAVPLVCTQKASLRRPDTDRTPDLLLILAAEHTAGLLTPEP